MLLVNVEPSPFSPDGDGFDDITNIHYTIAEPARVTITIYNTQDYLIRTLLENVPRMTLINTEEWDGKDDSGANVSAGLYTCRIDAVDANNQHAPQVSCEITVFYPSARISGTVTDGEYPIYNVLITDGYRTTTTALDGTFSIRGVPSGTYTVSAAKEGYTDSSREVNIQYEGEDVTHIDFLLSPEGTRTGVISGIVTDEDTNPVIDVRITDGVHAAFTNEDGFYILENIDSGNFYLTASKRGFHSAFYSGAINEGEILTGINFLLIESNEPDIRTHPEELIFRVVPAQSSVRSFKNHNPPDFSQPPDPDTSPFYDHKKGEIIPGEYIVKFKKTVDDDEKQEVLYNLGVVIKKKNK